MDAADLRVLDDQVVGQVAADLEDVVFERENAAGVRTHRHQQREARRGLRRRDVRLLRIPALGLDLRSVAFIFECDRIAQFDQKALVQQPVADDALAVDEGAVARRQVLDLVALGDAHQPAVLAAHLVVPNDDVVFAAAPDGDDGHVQLVHRAHSRPRESIVKRAIRKCL